MGEFWWRRFTALQRKCNITQYITMYQVTGIVIWSHEGMWRSKFKVFCVCTGHYAHTLAQTLSLTGRHPPKGLQRTHAQGVWSKQHCGCTPEVCFKTASNRYGNVHTDLITNETGMHTCYIHVHRCKASVDTTGTILHNIGLDVHELSP